MESTRFAAHAVAFLLDVSLRSLAVFAVAGLVCLGLRRASASARHALWTVTLISLLLLPVLCAGLPRWEPAILPAHQFRPSLQVSHGSGPIEDDRAIPSSLTTVAPHETTSSADVSTASTPGAARDTSAAKDTNPPVTQFVMPKESPSQAVQPIMASPTLPGQKSMAASTKSTLAQWLFGAWLLGVAAVVARTLVSLAAAVGLVLRTTAVTPGPLMEAAEGARQTLALAARPCLRVGNAEAPVAVPMMCGVFRPVVLLPQGADAWPPERLRVVLLHEMGHVKRRDWVTTMLAQIVCALYWFHPLVWLTARRLRAEGEAACDDMVLTSGVPAQDYAAHLLSVVRGMVRARGQSPAVVTMAPPREVAGRLKTILADRRDRRAVGQRGLALAALMAAGLLGPLAAVRPVAAVEPKGSSEGQRPSHEDVGPKNGGIKPNEGLRRILEWRRTLARAEASPWKATLPDDTIVTLEDLWALNGDDGGKFWTPDGTLLAAEGNGAPSYRHLRPLVCNIDLVVTFPSDGARRQARVSIGKAGERPGHATDLGDWDANAHGTTSVNVGFQDTFPRSAKKIDLVVSVATGSETTLVGGSPKRGATRRLSTGEVVTQSPVAVLAANHAGGQGQRAQVRFTMPSRFVHDQSEYRICVLGANGQPLDPQQVWGASQSYPVFNGRRATVLYTFGTNKLPLSQVKAFRLTYRPACTVTFRDVALRPSAPRPVPSTTAGDVESPTSGVASPATVPESGSTSSTVVPPSEKAAQVVRTLSFSRVMRSYDTAGRRIGEAIQTRTWERRNPPAVATTGDPKGWTTLTDPRGRLFRTAQRNYLFCQA